MTKMKNHQPQGANHRKVSKRNKLYIGKINNNDEEQWQCQEWEEL